MYVKNIPVRYSHSSAYSIEIVTFGEHNVIWIFKGQKKNQIKNKEFQSLNK